jgi:hypothetical protein
MQVGARRLKALPRGRTQAIRMTTAGQRAGLLVAGQRNQEAKQASVLSGGSRSASWGNCCTSS